MALSLGMLFIHTGTYPFTYLGGLPHSCRSPLDGAGRSCRDTGCLAKALAAWATVVENTYSKQTREYLTKYDLLTQGLSEALHQEAGAKS
jgi:hypothetical protein